jgi:arsenite methyltransferase
MTRTRPDYGIDGYPYLLGFCIGATVAFGIAVAALGAGSRVVAAVLFGLAAVAAIPASLGLHYVLRGKARQRDRLLARIEWRGDEQVLDVGTGGGLLAIGAAKRAPRGRAFGIDTWRAEDLSRNTKLRVLENARIEGVSERVEIRNDDARSLSFDDATFDVVVSMLCIHNIDDEPGRARALDEMVRVLRPGGAIAIADLAGIEGYAARLRSRGLEVEVTGIAWDTFPFQRVLVARERSTKR